LSRFPPVIEKIRFVDSDTGILSIIRGKKPGFWEKPGFLPIEPQVIEKIRFRYSAGEHDNL
jgi:hypothetical protein